LSREIGNRLWEGNALLNLGVAYRQVGQTEQARSTMTRARDVLLMTQDKLGIGRSFYNLALMDGDLGDYQAATDQLERALPIIRSVDIRHSHDIETTPTAYYNPIEESALDLLVRWEGELGNTEKAGAYAKALQQVRARRPAESKAVPDHEH
jgi:tetratricopeptide (TPR) repeat protein